MVVISFLITLVMDGEKLLGIEVSKKKYGVSFDVNMKEI